MCVFWGRNAQARLGCFVVMRADCAVPRRSLRSVARVGGLTARLGGTPHVCLTFRCLGAVGSCSCFSDLCVCSGTARDVLYGYGDRKMFSCWARRNDAQSSAIAPERDLISSFSPTQNVRRSLGKSSYSIPLARCGDVVKGLPFGRIRVQRVFQNSVGPFLVDQKESA